MNFISIFFGYHVDCQVGRRHGWKCRWVAGKIHNYLFLPPKKGGKTKRKGRETKAKASSKKNVKWKMVRFSETSVAEARAMSTCISGQFARSARSSGIFVRFEHAVEEMSTGARPRGDGSDARAERRHCSVTPDPERKHPVKHWSRSHVSTQKKGGIKKGQLTRCRERFRRRLTCEMGE